MSFPGSRVGRALGAFSQTCDGNSLSHVKKIRLGAAVTAWTRPQTPLHVIRSCCALPSLPQTGEMLLFSPAADLRHTAFIISVTSGLLPVYGGRGVTENHWIWFLFLVHVSCQPVSLSCEYPSSLIQSPAFTHTFPDLHKLLEHLVAEATVTRFYCSSASQTSGAANFEKRPESRRHSCCLVRSSLISGCGL